MGDLDLKFEALRCLGGGVESQRNAGRMLFGVGSARDQSMDGDAEATELRM